MPFDWKEYFELAKFLSKPPKELNPEACLRSSVSRAYFSCFCFLRNYAKEKSGFQPHYNDEDHTSVRDHFKAVNKSISDKLQDLRVFRNLCDYTDNLQGLDGIHQNAINAAEEIFGELN